MSISEFWRGLTGKPERSVPSHVVLPRMRESSGLLPAIRPKPATATAEATPPAPQPVLPPAPAEPAPIAPPAWAEVFPVHYKALIADLQRRGEDPANWEVQDGRDLGVSESGHTVAFRVHKTGTSATIQVELTMCKGQLARVRVR